MLGSAVVRRLSREQCEVVTVEKRILDLTDARRVATWLADAKPDAIVLAAARVGGIQANLSYPASFLQQNLAIVLNVVEAARQARVGRLVNFGSSCMYPRAAPQPITEDCLLSGPLEPTNEAYAMAKISGVKLVESYRRQYGCDFISMVPTNLYGPGDNFDPDGGHVIPGLIKRFGAAIKSGARSMEIWGSGKPRREFMFVDDAADAVVFLLQHYSDDKPINVGIGTDISIAELANELASIVRFEGRLEFDSSKPDGMARKLLDSSRLRRLGWQGARPLQQGLQETYAWFRERELQDQPVDGLRAATKVSYGTA